MTIYNSCKYDSMVMGDWRSRLNLTHPCTLKIEVEKKKDKKKSLLGCRFTLYITLIAR